VFLAEYSDAEALGLTETLCGSRATAQIIQQIQTETQLTRYVE